MSGHGCATSDPAIKPTADLRAVAGSRGDARGRLGERLANCQGIIRDTGAAADFNATFVPQVGDRPHTLGAWILPSLPQSQG